MPLTDGSEPDLTVVVPPDGSLAEVAERLVQEVRRAHGIELSIQPGDHATGQLHTRHAIALGCLADNPFIEALYRRWNCLVDRWYPGSGGWVIQTITSPFRHGEHVILLGGSDAMGVQAAVSRWIEYESLETLDATRTRLPWQFEVQLGANHLPLPEDRIDVMGTSASMVATPESELPSHPYESGWISQQTSGPAQQHLLRLGMYGPHADNFHLSRSSQLGLRYLYTGHEDDAKAYRDALLAEARAGVIAKLYHYKSLRMFQLWGLLAPCPVFSDAEREEISDAMRDYLLQESGIAQIDAIRSASIPTQIFSRHHACEALNLWAGADWLWRQTGKSRWLEDRAVADAYFDSQAGTDVPLTGLTEGYASYLEVVLEWMLLGRPGRIADDPHIGLWAERVLGLCTNMGQLVLGPQTDIGRYPYHLLRKLTFLLQDGRFLFAAGLREHQVKAGIDRVLQFSAGQAYAGDVETVEPAHAPAMTIYPLNERLRAWQAPSISADQGFDRAVARSGWQRDDDYFMVIGIRSGGKSLPNVGALAAYERFGRRLITSEAVPLFPHSASAWRHSTVTIGVDGRGFGMAAGAEIITEQEIAGGHLLALCVSQGDSRWIRQIYWKPAAFVFVIDRVTVRPQMDPDADAGSLQLGVNWRCGGSLLAIDAGLATLDLGSDAVGRFYVEVSDELSMASEHNTYPAIGAPPGTTPLTETMLHATMESCGKDNAGSTSNTVEVATLLHAVEATREPLFRLHGHAGHWRIDGEQHVHHVEGDVTAGTLAIEVADVESLPNLPAPGQPVDPALLRRVPDSDGRQTARQSPPDPLTGEDVSQERAPSRRSASMTDGQATCDLPVHWSHDLPAPISTWTLGDHGALAVGTEAGDVIVVGAQGNRRSTASLEASVTALAFFGHDLLAGTREGRVSRFDKHGQQQWCHQCRFRPERTFYPYWFLETPCIGALATGHDPVLGRDLVAAGTGSTSLNFLDASTGDLIQDQLSPYGLPDRIQVLQPAEDGPLQFLVGHSWLTCGSTVRAWSLNPETSGHPDAAPATDGSTDPGEASLSSREGIRYYRNVEAMGRSGGDWDSCGVTDFWIGSLAPGLADVLLLLRHGSVNQLTLYDLSTGDPLWDVTLAGSPIALAVVPIESGAESGTGSGTEYGVDHGALVAPFRCFVIDQFGWLIGFDGEGHQLMSSYVADSLRGLYADAGRLALWSDHELHLGADGAITHHHKLTGTPLGWWQHEEVAGLLCVEQDRLILRRVTL